MVLGIFMPLLQLYSDPDYLNQYLTWLVYKLLLSASNLQCFDDCNQLS